MSDVARLLSVCIGLPRDIEWKGRTVRTGVWKTRVPGRHLVRRLNIDGDGQGDLAGHGGEHRAVLVYQLESYRYWQEQLKRTDFVHGQVGENFTIEGLPDDLTCIGGTVCRRQWPRSRVVHRLVRRLPSKPRLRGSDPGLWQAACPPLPPRHARPLPDRP